MSVRSEIIFYDYAETYHVSDDITPQMKVIDYSALSRNQPTKFQAPKRVWKSLLILIDLTANWNTRHKHTNNINLKQTYWGKFQYFIIWCQDWEWYTNVSPCIKFDLQLVVYTFGQCQFNMIDVHNSIKGSYMTAHF